MSEDRKRTRFTPVHALFAAAILGLAVIPLAGAGADEPEATAAAVSKSKFKKLKKRVGALEDQVNALARQPGPAGPQGLQGPQGAQGATGAGGVTNFLVRTTGRLVAANGSSTFGVGCGDGERATGGGVGFTAPAAEDVIGASNPTVGGVMAANGQTADGWRVMIHNGFTAERFATGFVICASP